MRRYWPGWRPDRPVSGLVFIDGFDVIAGIDVSVRWTFPSAWSAVMTYDEVDWTGFDAYNWGARSGDLHS